MSQNNHCLFCDITQASSPPRIIEQNNFALVIRGGHSVSQGHSLIIPSALELLGQGKVQLDGEFQPAVYNIGINYGVAVGPKRYRICIFFDYTV